MADHMMDERVLDARPDRIDFRDLQYRPRLISLPNQFPSEHEIQTFLDLYLASGSIHDQGAEGACTGFGLATVIDYISWDRTIRENRKMEQSKGHGDEETAANLSVSGLPGVDRVSPYMLYDIAKMYDEWEGEDYSGSSCRGALKGWHKHGACEQSFWRSAPNSFKPPVDGWRQNAAERPLGAYYRVDARSISDLQAAIHEVRAVYVSSRVHDGWQIERVNSSHKVTIGGFGVPVIQRSEPITGGHAFALIGYTQDGFIVQNSWGTKWGFNGFALMTYDDWIENGNDAWVAALAAPMTAPNSAVPRNRTSTPLSLRVSLSPQPTMQSDRSMEKMLAPALVPAWSSDKAYDHSIVLGNEGLPLRRRIDALNAKNNLEIVACKKPFSAARENSTLKVMIYAHGGLNSEKVSIERAMCLGPWMQKNGIYPIFLVWRTSVLETLSNITGDFVRSFEDRREDLQAEGLDSVLDSAQRKLQNAFDKAFEVAAETTVGKPIWSQMKQNASASADGNGGMRLLLQTLRSLKNELRDRKNADLEVHIVGHSAGAILLGHMLDDFDKAFPVNSTTLFAPACTMEFATRYYGRALKQGIIPKNTMRLHVLSDENERRDSVGPYKKSLLYLVSRALETPRKQPLLGLAKCLDEGNQSLAKIVPQHKRKPKKIKDKGVKQKDELPEIKSLLQADYSANDLKYVRDWRHLADEYKVSTQVAKEREFKLRIQRFEDSNNVIVEEPVKVQATHGGFDNSLMIMNATIARILNKEEPPFSVDDLSGF